jgi:hypothetical protein
MFFAAQSYFIGTFLQVAYNNVLYEIYSNKNFMKERTTKISGV